MKELLNSETFFKLIFVQNLNYATIALGILNNGCSYEYYFKEIYHEIFCKKLSEATVLQENLNVIIVSITKELTVLSLEFE